MAIQDTIGIGTVLGAFEIEKVLGRGGMGVVYKAHESSLNRKVALKVLSHMLSADQEFITRFRKEAQIIAALHHPNIVSILSFGQDLGHYYFAMEYIQGTDLADILKEKRIIPLDEALQIARQVADALSEAGKKGVVHRDLKPANIMIDEMNRVRVTDFGVARIESANDNLTKTGMFLGSPQYASPEQAEGRAIDPRSDIYSLGAVLYRMLAGTPPTVGDSPLAVVVKLVSETVTPIEQVNSTLPKPVCDLIGKMMAKDANLRYQSAQDVITAIDQCLRSISSGTADHDEETIVHPPPAPEVPVRQANRKTWLPWAIGGLGVVTLCLLIWGGSTFLADRHPSPDQVSALAPIDQPQQSAPTQALPPADSHPPVEKPQEVQVAETTLPAAESTAPPAPTILPVAESPMDHTTPAAPEKQITQEAPKPSTGPLKKTPETPQVIPAADPVHPEKVKNEPASISSQPSKATISTPRTVTPAKTENEQVLILPDSPNVLLLVSGPDDMTLPLQSHLESTLHQSRLNTLSPVNIPILYKKMQMGELPVNWYDIKQFTPDAAAQVLVLATIQKTGSTMLRFHGTSQEQTATMYSIKVMDMNSGVMINPTITGTVRYTALNMQDEFQDSLNSTVGDIGQAIHDFWEKKKQAPGVSIPVSPPRKETKQDQNV